MQQFSIRDIENLCGIRAHTLRVWEQRYGLRLCKRRESLRRYYDNEDLKQLLRISYLYHHGYKISCIASLGQEEILNLAGSSPARGEYDILITQMLEASLDFDEIRLEKLVDSVLGQMDFETAIEKLFYPFLEKIGLLWMTNHVLPAQEHFSSQIIQKKIICCIDALQVPLKPGAKKVLLFCPEGEFHELPLLVNQYLLKKNGHKPIFLGKNTGWNTLRLMGGKPDISMLALHLITNFSNLDPVRYLQRLQEIFPGKPLVLTGPGFSDLEKIPPGSLRLDSLNQFIQFAKKL